LSALLEAERLNVRIPLAAGMLHPVRDVSFSVKRGEMLCLVGESGCGKSLTSLALMDLLPKHSRREAQKLIFDGIDLLRLRERAMADLRGNGIADRAWHRRCERPAKRGRAHDGAGRIAKAAA
jgi:peptide/nickel transport system ATP-binding protein